MSYGALVDNLFGRSQIDGDTRQLDIVKEGIVTPEPIGRLNPSNSPDGNTRRANTNVPRPVIIPYSSVSSREAIIFIKPYDSGNGTAARLRVGAKGGSLTYKWVSYTSQNYTNNAGQAFMYAKPVVGTPTLNNIVNGLGSSTSSYVRSDGIYSYSQLPLNNYEKDSIGMMTGNYSHWTSYTSSGDGHPRIYDIEAVGISGIYKIYFEPYNDPVYGDNFTGITQNVPNNISSLQVTFKCVWFHSPNHLHFAEDGFGQVSGWSLAYKMGYFTDRKRVDNSTGYGMEVYNNQGICTWSSERETFQAESMVKGHIAIEPANSAGEWTNTPAVNPVIHHKYFDQDDEKKYWAMLTTKGAQAVYIYNESDYPIPRRTVSFAAGFTFNYDHSTFSNGDGAGQANEESITTNRAVRTPNTNYEGISLSPFEEGYIAYSPSSSRRGTWYSPKAGALVIGKLY